MNKIRKIRQQRPGPAKIPFICAATLSVLTRPRPNEQSVRKSAFQIFAPANSENPENPSKENQSLVLDWTSVAFGRSKTLKLSTATAQKTGK